MTTEEVRISPYSILIALDKDNTATGNLYLDNGISLIKDTFSYLSYTFYPNQEVSSDRSKGSSYTFTSVISNIGEKGPYDANNQVTVIEIYGI